MKDWRRSPEPAGMMGLKETSYAVHGAWGPPSDDFDPAAPLPSRAPSFISAPLPHLSATRSLYSMALRVILRNISSVQDLGVLPYRHAKPILEECRIDQLILLEENSPHLLEHTEEIWKRNALRDFIDLRRRYTTEVKEPKSWRKLYFRTKGETEQAKVDAAKRIKDKYEQHRAEKDAKKLVVSDRSLHKTGKGTRRVGAPMPGTGGMSKGQTLLNKARSGSAAQAKLTGRPTNAFRVQGRSKAVGVEIAPEAAGVVVKQTVRPMVAPRKVLGGASEGLAQMREFSRPMPGSEDSTGDNGSASTSVSRRVDSSRWPDTVGVRDGEATGLPRLKPRDVAAAPSLTSASIAARDTDRSNGVGSSSPSASSFGRKEASSPPPDIARTERRKVDFFGSGAKVSPSPSTGGTSSSLLGKASSSASSSASGVEVRGMKRAHSNGSRSVDGASSSSRSNGASSSSKPATSPPNSSPTATSFFQSKAGSGGVRVVSAKRARTQERASSPPSAPSPSSSASAPTINRSSGHTGGPQKATSSVAQNGIAAMSRPTPIRHSSSNVSTQDARTVRASPAALSSIFMPSSSPTSASRRSNGGAVRR
ncbi:RNA polymerase II transcription factor SIII, subunit A [Kalmanozyma brasiliensis GHG001]|uniref:RNA polymerase II transcription factor SIII, subunit A n=1 Tax=Kalmanozyma brasiliensis (strain GHG001) TaxID=1365824 RepID=UPI002868281B|nr:RNA polymerase II transcription factor SIII, subunit A [Kalmanozyma brasiliensis GHG001]EST08997.2 RNA polymerase II transcription factor SIII, subunit A [Kalmanozyma brasiliensis GHG001]